jgi:ankyrin repeat protein
LHFAALAGKVEICKLLLQNGVKIERTNSVKRNAAQMAAFVGKWTKQLHKRDQS